MLAFGSKARKFGYYQIHTTLKLMLIIPVSEHLHAHICVVHAYLAQMGSNRYRKIDS